MYILNYVTRYIPHIGAAIIFFLDIAFIVPFSVIVRAIKDFAVFGLVRYKHRFSLNIQVSCMIYFLF